MQEGTRQGELLLHSLGVAFEDLMAPLVQVDLTQHRSNPLVQPLDAVELPEEAEILVGRHLLVKVLNLGQDADAPLDIEVVLRELLSEEPHLAFGGRDEPQDHHDRRRLAGSVWAQKAVNHYYLDMQALRGDHR